MGQGLTQNSRKQHSDASHLTRKKGIYYCRRAQPDHLGTDVALSLGTRNFREAEHLVETLDPVFSRAVQSSAHPADLRAILRRYLEEALEGDLPLLDLYHGNRLEEFAQLRREDVKQEDGISYLHIHGEDGRQIKNEQSARRVPVHPELERRGFLDYVRETAPNASDMVFPLLKPGGPDKKVGYYFTKWWTNYRKAIGIYEPGLDYHSFRHGVTTKLYAAHVSPVIVDELTGHEGEGTSQRVYKKDMPLSVLRDAIEKVEWPELS